MGNQIKTILLLGGLSALVVWIGGLVAPGQTEFFLALAFAMNFFMYFFSSSIVLRMHQAKPLTANDHPKLHAMVAELARRADLPMPQVFWMDSPQPNAFATGRNPSHGVVAVTRGLYDLLTERELRGVIAHELAHIKHRDILIATVAAILASTIGHLASVARWSMMFNGSSRQQDEREGPSGLEMLVMLFVAPLAAFLVQMGISRAREYLADAGGARICGDPQALASALQKMQQGAKAYPMHTEPATASLFIVNPFSGGNRLFHWFSTHPPTEERIRRLQQMAHGLV